jgi:hypothetical protein
MADANGADARGLTNFIGEQRWGGTELRNRLIHARNRIRLIAEPAYSNGQSKLSIGSSGNLLFGVWHVTTILIRDAISRLTKGHGV